MLRNLFVAFAFLTSSNAYAADFAVVSVVRSLPLKGDEAVSKDYYINAGSNNGLVKGAIIEAMRKLPVHDNLTSKVAGDTAVPVARLKIIHIDKNVAVARMVKVLDRAATPVSGFDDVMIGDLIRVADEQ